MLSIVDHITSLYTFTCNICLKTKLFKQKNFHNSYYIRITILYSRRVYYNRANGLIPNKEYFPHKILSNPSSEWLLEERRVKITWRFPLTRGMGAAEPRQSFAVANKEGFPSLLSPLVAATSWRRTRGGAWRKAEQNYEGRACRGCHVGRSYASPGAIRSFPNGHSWTKLLDYLPRTATNRPPTSSTFLALCLLSILRLD